MEICREFTDKVFQEGWLGYGPQKNLCASKAINRWVLNVDADEVISSECAAEIQKLLSRPARISTLSVSKKKLYS